MVSVSRMIRSHYYVSGEVSSSFTVMTVVPAVRALAFNSKTLHNTLSAGVRLVQNAIRIELDPT